MMISNMRKFIFNLCFVCVAIIFAWLVISWVDIFTHNLTDCAYWQYNLFPILAELIK